LFHFQRNILGNNMNILRIIVLLILPILGISQAPTKINFQSVLRNTNGEVVSNSAVSLRISILSGTINGSAVYIETHAKTTDAGGLMSLQIGGGTVLSGVFGDINWGSSAHFIKLEADFSGGNSYVLLGTQELMSVPYALYASKTDTSVLNLTSRFSTKLSGTDTASLSARINAKAPINNPTFTGTVGGISKTMVGLGNVDNTSDAGKPISTATQTALDLKAPFNNPTFTGTVGGISKTMVGLGNVDNTSDAGKPISTATQTALDLKAPINDPTFTGTVGGISKTMVGLGNVDNTSDAGKPISTVTQTALDLKAPINNPTFTGTVGGISKTMVGLGNVDNTSDAGKSISTATQTALDNKLNKTDTSTMLENYRTGLNNKVNVIDTSNMLSKYLRKADTSSLSDRINAKLSRSVIPETPIIQRGHIMYWNGSSWVLLNPGTAGQVLKMSLDENPVPVWGTDATTFPAFSPCGAPISDIDGNIYNTVLIGAQCWTKENLRVRRYNKGRSIPFDAIGGSGGSSSTWSNLTIGAHTIYANDSTTTPSNRTKYGYLYNWYAAKGIYTTGTMTSTDTLNICPEGWHVPTDADWTTLTTELGGESVAGGKMKSIGTAYWSSQSAGTDNSSGFSALPGGYRIKDGSFNNLRNSAVFWRATEDNANNAWSSRLEYNSNNVSRNSYEKQYGASIRCLKD
jgi:uncharacterized protein (TIGR02145 family)